MRVTPKSNPMHAGIDIIKDHPFSPQKGDRRVLFLKVTGTVGDDPGVVKDWYYETTDVRFGVQPDVLVTDLKRLAGEIVRDRAK